LTDVNYLLLSATTISAGCCRLVEGGGCGPGQCRLNVEDFDALRVLNALVHNIVSNCSGFSVASFANVLAGTCGDSGATIVRNRPRLRHDLEGPRRPRSHTLERREGERMRRPMRNDSAIETRTPEYVGGRVVETMRGEDPTAFALLEHVARTAFGLVRRVGPYELSKLDGGLDRLFRDLDQEAFASGIQRLLACLGEELRQPGVLPEMQEAIEAETGKARGRRLRWAAARPFLHRLEALGAHHPLLPMWVVNGLGPFNGARESLMGAGMASLEAIGAWQRFARSRHRERRAADLRNVTLLVIEGPYKRHLETLWRLQDVSARRSWGNLPNTVGRLLHALGPESVQVVDTDAALLRNAAAHGHWQYDGKTNEVVYWKRPAKGQRAEKHRSPVPMLGRRVASMFKLAETLHWTLQRHAVDDMLLRSGLLSS